MHTTLIIMAAGLGTRFGDGIKQLAPVGPGGECIMEYSVYDAIGAGFDKIVFIIRKEIEEAFRERIGKRLERAGVELGVEIVYVYQEMDMLPNGVVLPEGRKKPWGTAQAVLCCRDVVKEPFAVINADDYYGKTAFRKIHAFLEKYTQERSRTFCMAGFVLENTLRSHGAVTRGICDVDEKHHLTAIHETSNIVQLPSGAGVVCKTGLFPLDPKSCVSMNMWGLTPEFMELAEQGLKEFFGMLDEKSILLAEYLLPIYINKLIMEKRVSVEVLKTTDQWFGVTYQEDLPCVADEFKKMTEAGIYPKQLFAD